jgi:hypothetical protein
MTPKLEFISVCLEIVAFFCVTLDLYGKERLEALTERLVCVTGIVLRWFTRAYWQATDAGESSDTPIWKVGGIMTAVLLPMYLLLFLFFWSIVVTNGNEEAIRFFSVMMPLMFLIFSTGPLLYILSALTLFATWLLKRVKFSGVLLLVGTALFVGAKGIVWWHSLMELTKSGHAG